MSENTENNKTGDFTGGGMKTMQQVIQTVIEPTITVPKTWEFEGKTYDLFLANKTGGIGMPIVNPRDKSKTLGILSAQFMWDKSDAFIDRLDIETIDKATAHDDWVERENESMMLKNARFFSEVCVGGQSIDFDELGEALHPVSKTREQMLSYRKPVQSDLVGLWLSQFHIERWLPDGMTAIDALLSNPSEIYFTCKIGDYHNPRHVLFMEFKTPTDDAISAYQTDTFNRGQNQDGDWRYTRDNESRLRFARKYFTSVSGAMLGPLNKLEFDDSELTPVVKTDTKAIEIFKSNFNPDWMIRLGDELASAFNLGKK